MTGCELNASAYLALYLYGLVCVGLGFALALLLTIRRSAGGYQPIDRGHGQPSAPPRKP